MPKLSSKVLALVAATLIWCVACQARPALVEAPAAVSKAPAASLKLEPQADKAYHYSPFTIALHGGSDFTIVTFKDVGLVDQPGSDEALLETIAEGLAMSMASHEGLSYATQVSYDKRYSDPRNHASCGARHLYVDVWRSQGPDRLGYSLWSGCSETDNFAWKEVPLETPVEADAAGAATILGNAIAESLSQAQARRCYQREC